MTSENQKQTEHDGGAYTVEGGIRKKKEIIGKRGERSIRFEVSDWFWDFKALSLYKLYVTPYIDTHHRFIACISLALPLVCGTQQKPLMVQSLMIHKIVV